MHEVIQSKRLTLRPFAVDDAAWVAEALIDFDVARWIPMLPYPYSLADAQGFVAKQSGPEADALAVTHGDTPVGCITTAKELGYWFAQGAWGQGFATEAARAIVAHHFDGDRDLLESGYILGNNRSQHVLEKLGFVPKKTVQRLSSATNTHVTIQRMELTASDWETRA